MMDSLECGAADFDAEDEYYEVVTDPDSYYDVKDALEAKGYTFVDSSLGPVATTLTTITDEDTIAALEKMFEMMEENEDIQEYYHSWDN